MNAQAGARSLYPHPDDRPLAGAPHPDHRVHFRLYGCECAATILLMLFGSATNILLGAPESPIGRTLMSHPLLQTALMGLFFGAGGSLAALSPFGRVSGGHVSPSVSLAFALGGRLAALDLAGYVAAQMAGAACGSGLVAAVGFVSPHWGAWARSVHDCATLPFPLAPVWWAVVGEAATTMVLIGALLLTGAHARLRRVTPLIAGPLFFCLNPFEAWLSGDSTNLARSFGPALMAGDWRGFWVYVIGPACGSTLMVALIRLEVFGVVKLHEARIAYFGHHGRAPFLFRA
jgi:aquaporin Z